MTTRIQLRLRRHTRAVVAEALDPDTGRVLGSVLIQRNNLSHKRYEMRRLLERVRAVELALWATTGPLTFQQLVDGAEAAFVRYSFVGFGRDSGD